MHDVEQYDDFVEVWVGDRYDDGALYYPSDVDELKQLRDKLDNAITHLEEMN